MLFASTGSLTEVKPTLPTPFTGRVINGPPRQADVVEDCVEVSGGVKEDHPYPESRVRIVTRTRQIGRMEFAEPTNGNVDAELQAKFDEVLLSWNVVTFFRKSDSEKKRSRRLLRKI